MHNIAWLYVLKLVESILWVVDEFIMKLFLPASFAGILAKLHERLLYSAQFYFFRSDTGRASEVVAFVKSWVLKLARVAFLRGIHYSHEHRMYSVQFLFGCIQTTIASAALMHVHIFISI